MANEDKKKSNIGVTVGIIFAALCCLLSLGYLLGPQGILPLLG